MRPGPVGCGEIRYALGVYVLGAIDPAERTVVDRHLATCPACRDERADLAGLPALLGRLTLAEVESLDAGDVPAGQAPPGQASAGQPWGAQPAGETPARQRPAAEPLAEPPTLRSILGEAAHRRAHRRRAAVLAVAAAAVVLAGATAAVRAWISGPTGPAPRPEQTSAATGWQRQVTATDPHSNVRATVRFSAKRWGTAVEASVDGVSYGTRCVLWAADGTGRHVEIASWTYATDGAWYPGSSSVQAPAIKSFDITAGSRTLVTVPAT
jgi:anti-sigma factor RsiW